MDIKTTSGDIPTILSDRSASSSICQNDAVSFSSKKNGRKIGKLRYAGKVGDLTRTVYSAHCQLSTLLDRSKRKSHLYNTNRSDCPVTTAGQTVSVIATTVVTDSLAIQCLRKTGMHCWSNKTCVTNLCSTILAVQIIRQTDCRHHSGCDDREYHHQRVDNTTNTMRRGARDQQHCIPGHIDHTTAETDLIYSPQSGEKHLNAACIRIYGLKRFLCTLPPCTLKARLVLSVQPVDRPCQMWSLSNLSLRNNHQSDKTAQQLNL